MRSATEIVQKQYPNICSLQIQQDLREKWSESEHSDEKMNDFYTLVEVLNAYDHIEEEPKPTCCVIT